MNYKAPKVVFLIAGISVAVAVSVAIYFYIQYKKVSTKPDETSKTVKAVSVLMELPSDEVPAIATVTDKTKLSQQDFFRRAENGDKVLIYAKAQKAILYRPSVNKIIDMAPVQSADPTPATQAKITPYASNLLPSPTKAQVITVAMYNGTSTQGLSYKLESVLKTKYNIQVTQRQEAAAKDYTKTEVIDISGKYKEQVADIAAFLNADIQNLPKGEVKPEVDILIIIGSDRQ